MKVENGRQVPLNMSNQIFKFICAYYFLCL